VRPAAPAVKAVGVAVAVGAVTFFGMEMLPVADAAGLAAEETTPELPVALEAGADTVIVEYTTLGTQDETATTEAELTGATGTYTLELLA